MKIAFVAPECDPFVKVGGLADVVASLPRTLRRNGHEVRIYIPRFSSISEEMLESAEAVGTVTLRGEDINNTEMPKSARILKLMSRDIPIFFVECAELFDVPHAPYGGDLSDPRRWAFFSLAVLEHLAGEPDPVDVIHAHDWPTGLLPVYKALRYKTGKLEKTAVLFTIHNIAHAGKFTKDWLSKLGLPDWLFDQEQLEFFGDWSMLKGGLLWSTMISTVSPRYADEIQNTTFGCGMDGVLRKRIDDLVGVLNGIDTSVWDPAAAEDDPAGGPWPAFDENRLLRRDGHRDALCAHFGLQNRPRTPIFGFVGSLTDQRGVSVLFDIIPKIISDGSQIVILGEGAAEFEDRLEKIHNMNRANVGVAIGFHPILAKRIYAGSDFFLMPSIFEPCGLSQMIACRYGSIPIVSFTGGLADTIRDADTYQDGNGITFQAPATLDAEDWLPVATKELAKAVDRSLRIYKDSVRFESIRRRAMRCDFTWERSARKYDDIYSETVRRERGEAGHFGP
ncbi:MAG: glycogen synthase [Planctomycetota bacterium]